MENTEKIKHILDELIKISLISICTIVDLDKIIQDPDCTKTHYEKAMVLKKTNQQYLDKVSNVFKQL